MNAMYSFGRIFFLCELGEKVTYQFNVFNEKVGDCKWYSFSIEMQRVYLIVLAGAQDPAIVQGYADTVCTRDAFKNVTLNFISLVLLVCSDHIVLPFSISDC